MANRSLIPLSDIFPRVQQFCESHNKVNSGLAESFRLNRQMALEKLALHFFYHLQKVRKAANDGDPQVPELRVSRRKLQEIFRCGNKSVYNYISFFEQAGVATKVFHGRQADFGVFLHPFFFNPAVDEPEVSIITDEVTPPSFSLDLSTFLPTNIRAENTKEINNSYNSNVENGENSNRTPSPRFQNQHISSKELLKKGVNSENLYTSTTAKERGGPQKLSTFTPTMSKKLDNLRNPDQKIKEKGSNCEVYRSEGNHGEVISPVATEEIQREAYAWQLVADFWAYCKPEFYPDLILGQKQVQKILQMIMDDVFKNFSGVSHNQKLMYNRYSLLKEALIIAKKYAVDHDWVSFLPPLRYFSRKFYDQQVAAGTRGSFYFTIKWAVENRNSENTNVKDIIFKKATSNYELSLTKHKSIDGIASNPLDIWSKDRNMIKNKLGNDYLNKYDQFVLSLNLNPNHVTKEILTSLNNSRK